MIKITSFHTIFWFTVCTTPVIYYSVSSPLTLLVRWYRKRITRFPTFKSIEAVHYKRSTVIFHCLCVTSLCVVILYHIVMSNQTRMYDYSHFMVGSLKNNNSPETRMLDLFVRTNQLLRKTYLHCSLFVKMDIIIFT